MHVRFLLGPAGSGKTHRCLGEIADELRRAPEGPPLLLFAPKQATFQLERQLLDQAGLPGYTRLQILSFERLAHQILTEAPLDPPKLLDEEGRLMVLRALLLQRRESLQVFHATARLPGFARELSKTLQELQRHHLGTERLHELAARFASPSRLGNKLHDLAVLLEAYLDWLKRHELKDGHQLLDLAVEAVGAWDRAQGQPLRQIGGLWLDGFAELTPQERALLTAMLPFCERATLAFCIEAEPVGEVPWISQWSVVAQTLRQCRSAIAALPGITVTMESLSRDTPHHRLAQTTILHRVERDWAAGLATDTAPVAVDALARELRIARCATPEAEATLAAHEILRHVRDHGGRYRDCAVLVRSLEGYHDTLRRVFRRYEIPFFLDRRQPVAHHPLAELTRAALRLPAYGWRFDDWFGALKTGLVPATEEEIDRLENDALAYGWEGDFWQRPVVLPKHPELGERVERLRLRLTPPFVSFAQELHDPAQSPSHQPSGRQLASALRELWRRLDIEKQLEAWSTETADDADLPPAVHRTVWEQMHQWVDNLERAFANDVLSLRQWLPILEAGLGNLSVGVIPPALDQVLLGSIDRSRNPDLRLALVLGLNEGVFPATPSSSVLLNDIDRTALETAGVGLSLNLRQRLAHERYLGYIACSRSRERLVLTCAINDARGTRLNPSLFLAQITRLVPGLNVENYEVPTHWNEAEHTHDFLPHWLAWQTRHKSAPAEAVNALGNLPALAELSGSARPFHIGQPDEAIPPAVAEALYGKRLRSSISRLEEFAACPFRFFVTSGLRTEERKLFQLDARERGNFQHELLARFHDSVRQENRQWRDLTPDEARQRLADLAAQMLPEFRDGLLAADPHSGFLARNAVVSLQNFIATLIEWSHRQYRFDPTAVEQAFGDETTGLPPWEINLAEGHTLVLRGKIDRIDVAADPEQKRALTVVLDYKSSSRQIDNTLMSAGIQLQLPAYLAALRAITTNGLGTGLPLQPAGFFYVNLQGARPAGKASSRSEILAAGDDEQHKTYRHLGRFDASLLPWLDSSNAKTGDQFKYRRKNDGGFYASDTDPLATDAFQHLLNAAENTLRLLGENIYSGQAGVNPARKKAYIACEFCPYESVCRIDPWTHSYRQLSATEPGTTEADE